MRGVMLLVACLLLTFPAAALAAAVPENPAAANVAVENAALDYARNHRPNLPDDLKEGTGRQPLGRPATAVAPRVQVLFFTATWCSPCQVPKQDLLPWLQAHGWRVDETSLADVRVIDSDQCPDLVQRWNVASLPTFILTADGRELSRGAYRGREAFAAQYSAAAARYPKPAATPPAPYGAVKARTIHGARAGIVNMIATLKKLMGENGSMTVELQRQPGGYVDLPFSDRAGLQVGNPCKMTYTLSGDVLTIRFTDPKPKGRFTFGANITQPVDAVKVSATEIIIELPRMVDVRLEVAD